MAKKEKEADQEIEQPWKEKIKFSALDPKFKVVQIPGQGQLRRFKCEYNLDSFGLRNPQIPGPNSRIKQHTRRSSI